MRHEFHKRILLAAIAVFKFSTEAGCQQESSPTTNVEPIA